MSSYKELTLLIFIKRNWPAPVIPFLHTIRAFSVDLSSPSIEELRAHYNSLLTNTLRFISYELEGKMCVPSKLDVFFKTHRYPPYRPAPMPYHITYANCPYEGQRRCYPILFRRIICPNEIIQWRIDKYVCNCEDYIAMEKVYGKRSSLDYGIDTPRSVRSRNQE